MKTKFNPQSGDTVRSTVTGHLYKIIIRDDEYAVVQPVDGYPTAYMSVPLSYLRPVERGGDAA